MGELKQHQPSMSVKDQITNLKNIGLIIADEVYAENITFEHLVDLYRFNANFRQLLFPEIEKIEINMRCRISNHFANTYGVLGYKQSDNFAKKVYHDFFIHDIHEEIRRNSKAPFVRNFRENYIDGELPIYALVEIFSFGMLSKFYKNMKNSDKKAVAKTFGVGYSYLESWIESISYVRNLCAHYGRLYNAKLSKTPTLYKEYAVQRIGNNRIFGVLTCMKHLLKGDSHWNIFLDQIEILFKKYERVDKTTMGFPEDWMEVLKM